MHYRHAQTNPPVFMQGNLSLNKHKTIYILKGYAKLKKRSFSMETGFKKAGA